MYITGIIIDLNDLNMESIVKKRIEKILLFENFLLPKIENFLCTKKKNQLFIYDIRELIGTMNETMIFLKAV